ncbi:MAG: OmpL47-type beta-barrel domain-containing protein [Promethearchaeota archaeon]
MKKRSLFQLLFLFMILFSSIINTSLINEKKNNNQVPKIAESYLITEAWNRTWDSGNIDAALDMEIGPSNNIFITGSIDNGRLILIIKYNSLGNQIWSRTWGGYATGDNWGYGVAEDSEGNVYVCGENILLKYDEFGSLIWSVNLKGALGWNLDIENSEYIYIAGEHNDDMILMKYDNFGNQIWNQTWGNSAKLDELHEIEINSEGDIIVGGQFHYEYAVTNWGTLIAKFNSSGFKIWQKTIGGYSSTAYNFRDFILDSNDNIFLCFTMGGPYLTYIYMLDSTGSRIRYAYIEDVYNCYLHLDVYGYLYLFITIDSVTPWRIRIYKLNPLLTTEWKSSWIYDETKFEYAVEMGGDSNDNIYTTLISSKGNVVDIIIAKFTPSSPLNPSILINSGESITYSEKVSLTLSALGAEEMCFKNGMVGDWTVWEPYNTIKELYLEGAVNNTEHVISVKFRNVVGESQIASDSIIYIYYDLIIEPNLDNFSINVGDSGFLLSWYVKSPAKKNDSFWITQNQVLISQGQWQHNTNITYFEMETLQAGLYNYTCFINDTTGKIVYSSIFVKVNLIPYIGTIKFPDNNIYSPNADYTFNCSWFDDDGTIQEVKFEFNNKNYTVLTDHSGEFSYTLSDLPANESGYKFRWHGLDDDGAWNSTQLFTYVLHKNNCQLLILFNGTLGDKISLLDNKDINITVINLNSTPGTLQLFINSQLVKEEIGYSLTYISKFSTGDFDINAYLKHENYTGTCHNLFKIVTSPCFINQSEDFTMIEGDIFKEIFWIPYIENENYGSFWIFRNGIDIINGSWNDSSIIYSNLYLLEPGFYNFTCLISDKYGFQNSSSVFVTILQNHCPNIFNTTNNITINIGTTSFIISWYTYDIDNNNYTYWIERNQELVESGIWKNNIEINYQESEILPSGIYNYTCLVKDISGAINQSTIFVKVNQYPYYSDLKFPNNSIYNPNTSYSFNCSWFDDDGSIQIVKLEFDGVNYSVYNKHVNEFSFTLWNLKANEYGYKFRWYSMDNDGAWTSTELNTFIIYKKITRLLILFNGTENNRFDAFNPFINITILNLDKTPGILQLFIDNELRKEESENVLTIISQFANGVYNITAFLVDENYTAYSTYCLFIEELTPPEIIFEYSEFYITPFTPEYYHETLTLTCVIYDDSPISWVYCCENTSGYFTNRSMINIVDRNWTTTLDISHLSWNDIITFYFYANDTWGNVGIKNNFTLLYSIRIFDFQAPSSKIEFIPHSGTNVVNKSTVFSIISNDNNGSGISTTFYRINNSNWIIYINPFNLSDFDSGTYVISFYSIDYADNIEETHSLIIFLIEPRPDQKTTTIQGYNMVIILIIISLVIILSIFKKKNKYQNF